MTSKNKLSVDVEGMTINGKPITEDELHVVYAVGRRGKPTKTAIAGSLSKVGICSNRRGDIIEALIQRRLLDRHLPLAIGVRGVNPVSFSLTENGKTVYQIMFGEPPVHAGAPS